MTIGGPKDPGAFEDENTQYGYKLPVVDPPDTDDVTATNVELPDAPPTAEERAAARERLMSRVDIAKIIDPVTLYEEQMRLGKELGKALAELDDLRSRVTEAEGKISELKELRVRVAEAEGKIDIIGENLIGLGEFLKKTAKAKGG